MRDLEHEIGARADDAVAAGKMKSADAQRVKGEVDAIHLDEQARRDARNFPPAEFDRINSQLLLLAAQVPVLPPLHPAESAPTSGWTEPSVPSTLDLTGYHISFDDEFGRLDIAPDGGRGRWFAPVHKDFGEAQFVPPGPGGPFSIVRDGPLGLGGTALAITATKGRDGWRSGLMQSVDGRGRGFSQRYGYFEMRARVPRGEATWPAFWLLTLNGLTDPTVTRGEIDVVEQYGSSPLKVHSSVHLWPAMARNAGGLPDHWYKSDKILVGDMADGFHRYGALLTHDWVAIYFDGRELARFPTPPQYDTPVYMLVDLAMHEKNLAHATSPSVLLVDYVRAYSRD